MLMLDYKPKKAVNPATKKTFRATTETLPEVLSFTEETLEGVGLSLKTTTALCVAIEEVFVNIAHYAYPEGEGDVTLRISFDKDNSSVTFTLRDKGVPFDPLAKADPDITLPAAKREIGGLGIFIAKKTMDSLSYTFENGENILTMTKTVTGLKDVPTTV